MKDEKKEGEIRTAWPSSMPSSPIARMVIFLICIYAFAGSYAARTLPLSSPTPPSWYHHPAIVIPGVLLTLPAILFTALFGNLIPRDGGAADMLLSHMLAVIDPVVTLMWCVVLFLLLGRGVRWFERSRLRPSSRDQPPSTG